MYLYNFLSKLKILYFILIYLILTFLFVFEAIITPHLNYALDFVDYGGTFRYQSFLIGSQTISLYWLAHFIGIICMILMCVYRAKKYLINNFLAILTAIFLAVFGYIGAKLLYIIENWNYFLKNGVSINGVSFFGTVFFIPIIIPIIGRIFKKDPKEYLDYCTPAGLVMLTCIRTGCFMNGCCRGITLWIFNRPVIIPAQLIECVLDLILLSIILQLETQQKYKGKLYIIFMGGYGILRFFVEFIRNTPKNIIFLSHAQLFSICCIVISFIALLTEIDCKDY